MFTHNLSGGYLVAALPGIPPSYFISFLMEPVYCAGVRNSLMIFVPHNFASVNDQHHCGTARLLLSTNTVMGSFFDFLFCFKLCGVFCVIVNCYFCCVSLSNAFLKTIYYFLIPCLNNSTTV